MTEHNVDELVPTNKDTCDKCGLRAYVRVNFLGEEDGAHRFLFLCLHDTKPVLTVMMLSRYITSVVADREVEKALSWLGKLLSVGTNNGPAYKAMGEAHVDATAAWEGGAGGRF